MTERDATTWADEIVAGKPHVRAEACTTHGGTRPCIQVLEPYGPTIPDAWVHAGYLYDRHDVEQYLNR